MSVDQRTTRHYVAVRPAYDLLPPYDPRTTRRDTPAPLCSEDLT